MKKWPLLALSFLLGSCSVIHSYILHQHIRNFWNWFTSEKKLFETLTDSNRDERLDLILEHLAPINTGLAVEVSAEFHGMRDIIISADGDKNNFADVNEIVSNAPRIQGWTVTAFRQKAKDDFVLKYDSLKFSPREMKFQPIIKQDSLDLIIYAPALKAKNQNDVVKYGLITMDNVLGEYAAVLKVRSYDFEDSKDISRDKPVYKLSILPEFVDSVYALNHR